MKERQVYIMSGVRTAVGEFGGAPDDVVSAAIEKLRNIGLTVDLRARMHEKIAIIDGEVLWHGSLNILSHRDTSESMLRIKSRVACEQMARFVSSTAWARDDSFDFGSSENPPCPDCGGSTVWKSGRYGIYFECENGCGGKIDPRKGRRFRKQAGGRKRRGKKRGSPEGETRPCPGPGCNGVLTVRDARYAEFWGCSNYPHFRYTKDA